MGDETKPIKTRCVCRFAMAAVVSLSGCASLNPWNDDQYTRARNSIEGYEDREGNWVRPEGIRADKRRNSDLPKFLQAIPGLAPRPVNKEVARRKYLEANELFTKASGLSVESEAEERRKLFRQAGKMYDDAGKDWVSSALEQLLCRRLSQGGELLCQTD
jgi:hypothetical protein